MITLYKNPACIVTVDTAGKNSKRGAEMNDIRPLLNHSIIVEDGIIKDIFPSDGPLPRSAEEIIDLDGKLLMPGLIECHTHTAFAGSRAEEFRQKISGVHYEEIAKRGGGINTTVNSVRSIGDEEFYDIVKSRINYFISQGITTIEMKSGYGLDFENEMKILRLISKLNETMPVTLIPTFLGAHTYPPEYKNNHSGYIDILIGKMLPYVSEHKLAGFCDVFCEKTAFSYAETEEILKAASNMGFKLKLHTDQFNSIGGVDLALKYKALSAEHLEVINEEDITKIASSNTAAVLLPGVSFFLGYQYAPARKLIDSNAVVAISTDYNPGSSHIQNLNLIMSIAALKMNMTIEETISAVTINSAKALGISDSVGSIELGKQADFSIFDTSDYSDIVYNVGRNLCSMTVKNGKVIYKNDSTHSGILS